MTVMSESRPSLLRKNAKDLKKHLFSSIAMMLTEYEDEDDLNAWLECKEYNNEESDIP